MTAWAKHAPRIHALLAPLRGRAIPRRHAACHGPAAYFLGLLEELMGNPEGAAELFEEAAEMAERMHAPPWLARIRFSQARMLLESGHPDGV